MICPNCMVQMHQVVAPDTGPVGGGYAETEDYYTWTLQICPTCGKYIKEEYRARVLNNVAFVDIDELPDLLHTLRYGKKSQKPESSDSSGCPDKTSQTG